MISNFRRAVYDKCGIVGYFATSSVADVSVKTPPPTVQLLPKRRYEITTIRCVRNHKSAVLSRYSTYHSRYTGKLCRFRASIVHPCCICYFMFDSQ